MAFKLLQLIDISTGKAAAVDPVDPARILEVLKGEEATKLTSILTTHHHWYVFENCVQNYWISLIKFCCSCRDHAGGNPKLVELYEKETGEKLEVYGGDSRVDALTWKVC